MGALEEVTDLAEAVTRHHSLRLWDVELRGTQGQTVVRIYVDGDTGIDLDKVAEVSEEISRGLDLRDPIPGRYTLEVSSPGLERPLKSRQHFELSLGVRVTLKTKQPMVGSSHRIDGSIVEAGERTVRIAADAGEVDVPYEEIKTARTVFEWDRSPKKERN